MKKIVLIIIIVILIFAVSSTAVIALYCSKYNLTNQLVTFSTYYSGIIMPILTLINIAILVWLTITVDQNDDTRNKKNVIYQKKIALMQLRKEEIFELSKVINNSLDIRISTNLLEMTQPIVFATTYLETFANTKLKIFSLSVDSDTTKKIILLHKKMGELNTLLNKGEKISNSQILTVLTLKNTIINNLQNIMLNEF